MSSRSRFRLLGWSCEERPSGCAMLGAGSAEHSTALSQPRSAGRQEGLMLTEVPKRRHTQTRTGSQPVRSGAESGGKRSSYSGMDGLGKRRRGGGAGTRLKL